MLNKIRIFLVILFFGLIFPAMAQADEFLPFQGEINSDNINLRTNSTTGSDIILKLSQGCVLDVVGELYEWYKVRLPSIAPSFIKKTLVSPLSGKTAKVIKDSVNIRLGPGESYSIIGKAYRDNIVKIVEDSGEWYRIEPVNNSFGWVHKKFANKISIVKKSVPQKTNEEPALTQNPIIEGNAITAEGTVSSYGKVFFRSATHKLICPLDKVFLLKGNKQVLNTYTFHKVRVTGKLNDASGQKYPIITIEKIIALD